MVTVSLRYTGVITAELGACITGTCQVIHMDGSRKLATGLRAHMSRMGRLGTTAYCVTVEGWMLLVWRWMTGVHLHMRGVLLYFDRCTESG